MTDKKEIGGYFSLELDIKTAESIHSQGIFLNSGRNALEYILSSLPTVKKVWIPYFTCDVVLEPIMKLRIPYGFYHINKQLEICNEIPIRQNEYILVTNYYGIKDEYIRKLALRYSSQLIIDNAQALFTEPIEGIKTIYSPRKFVGIPDGGIAYIGNGMDIRLLDTDVSYERCGHLLKRIDVGANAGYAEFKENSHKLAGQSIKRMSCLTKTLFSSIDFERIKKRRLKNFQILHAELATNNLLTIPDVSTFACPLVYPYHTNDRTLKKRLIGNKIFAATYWPNVFDWCKEDFVEYGLADGVVAIPIDQRYGEKEMSHIIKIIQA